MEVTLADYPDVAPLEVKISIKILSCEVAELIDPSETIISSLNQVFELPASGVLAMPLYEPSPLCGYSDKHVSYKLATAADGPLPDWISISPGLHQIEFEVSEDQKDLYGKEFSFKLTGTFTELFQKS